MKSRVWYPEGWGSWELLTTPGNCGEGGGSGGWGVLQEKMEEASQGETWCQILAQSSRLCSDTTAQGKWVFHPRPLLFWLPNGIWNSQTRNQIRATLHLRHNWGNYLLLKPTVRPGMEPASWICRDAADPFAPQQELFFFLRMFNLS